VQIIDVRVPGDELRLAPLGDIQYGASGVALAKLARHVEHGREYGWRFLGMGDYLDHFSPSNRKALLAAGSILYESASEIIDDAVSRRIVELVEGPLSGSEGRWLGLVQGDHEHVFLDGTHSDQRLAAELGAPFLGSAAIVNVYLGDFPRPLKIFATHGAGASANLTGKTLHLERLARAFKDCDVYLMGHSHLKYGFPLPRLVDVERPDGTRDIEEEKAICAITGSWLTAYVANSRSPQGFPQGGYAERGAKPPVPIGGVLITATPVEETWGPRWDLFVSA
jgi:hypothetical protein